MEVVPDHGPAYGPRQWIVEDLAFQPVAGRLARLLLERYQGAGPVGAT